MKCLDLQNRTAVGDMCGSMSDIEFLEKEIKEWLKSKTRKLQLTSERYYAGAHDITKRKRMVVSENGELVENAKLPNNKIVDNQFKLHVDKKADYLLGKPLTLTCEDREYAKKLQLVFGPRAMLMLFDVATDAIIGGKSWVHVYIKDDKIEFASYKASEILPFWESADHTRLDCAVRFYSVEEYSEDGRKRIVNKVEVFDGNGISRFLWDGGLKLDADTPTEPYFTVKAGDTFQAYNWKRVPLVPFKKNREEQPIVCVVKCLQDAYNLMMSDWINGMERSPMNTIIVVENAMGEDLGTLMHNLSQYNAVKVGTNMQGVKSDLRTLTIEVNSENYNLIKEALKKSIIENMRSYDAKDERLNGQPNQMNIQSVYSEIDLDANAMETQFKASFEDLLWFVAQHLSTMSQEKKNYETEPVKVIFNRDILINEKEAIENCNSSLGTMSKRSVLEQHPWIDDVEKELKRLKEEEEETREAEKKADPYASAFIGGRTDPAKGVTGDGAE